jgi:hypothetical protein
MLENTGALGPRTQVFWGGGGTELRGRPFGIAVPVSEYRRPELVEPGEARVKAG